MTNSCEPSGYRMIGPNRYREKVGFGLSDFSIGMVIEHRPGRTVTEVDNILMTTLTGNVAPIHLDRDFSEKTEWGQILVCSIVTLGIVSGMTVRSTSGLTVANLGADELRFPNPVFVGDTLYAESEVIAVRRSQSRPQNGVVTCRTVGFNQSAEEVVSFKRTFLVPANAGEMRDKTNY